MCFYYDGTCEVLNFTTPKARKVHRCYECGRGIQPGQVYQRTFAVFEGDATTTKTCLRCERLRLAVELLEVEHGCHGEEAVCPFGDLWDYIAEQDVEDRQQIGVLYAGLLAKEKNSAE